MDFANVATTPRKNWEWMNRRGCTPPPLPKGVFALPMYDSSHTWGEGYNSNVALYFVANLHDFCELL